MPKLAESASAMWVRKVTTPGRYAVGGVSGLQLRVSPSGAKYWLLRVRTGTARRDIGIGPWPEFGLAEARDRARELKDKIRRGIDPVAERQAVRAKPKVPTFDEAAERLIAAKGPQFRNTKHLKQWSSTLATYASPTLGTMPVDRIETAHVLAVLTPIWHDKTETAKRLRGRIEAVLDWARVSGFRTGENPAQWKGHLQALLPAPAKIAKVVHHRALPWREVPAFLVDLRNREGMAARALEFAVLTCARSGEVRAAHWGEIDLEARTWRVPGDRMKAGREHVVPLSAPVVALLEALPHREGLLFPAPRGGQLSDMALTAVCRRMGVAAVPHGFRSSFRDWCAEATNYQSELAEMALAHVTGSAVERAYRRGDLLEKRRALAEDWAEFCAGTGGGVVALAARRQSLPQAGAR